MILTYSEFSEVTGVELEEEEFMKLLDVSLLEINRYTFGRVSRNWESFPEWVKAKVRESLIDLIRGFKENPVEEKQIASESVGSHSVTYKVDKDAKFENRIGGIINKHLFDTGLLYRGLCNGK